MRKSGSWVDFVLMLLAVALVAAWQSTGQRTNALVGTWENADMTLDFRPDGSLKVVYRKFGGGPLGTYRVDFSRHPAELDVRLENKYVNFTSCEITPTGDLRISDDSQDPAGRLRTFGPQTLMLHRRGEEGRETPRSGSHKPWEDALRDQPAASKADSGGILVGGEAKPGRSKEGGVNPFE